MEKCGHCHGTGEVPCFYCGAKGTPGCPYCNKPKSGMMTCSDCGGTGMSKESYNGNK